MVAHKVAWGGGLGLGMHMHVRYVQGWMCACVTLCGDVGVCGGVGVWMCVHELRSSLACAWKGVIVCTTVYTELFNPLATIDAYIVKLSHHFCSRRTYTVSHKDTARSGSQV